MSVVLITIKSPTVFRFVPSSYDRNSPYFALFHRIR